jgi:uncharacterized protein (DUF2267 family)
MTTTGLEVFDKTIQITNGWLNEIMVDLGPDRHTAWHALTAVLRALRDRLPVDLAAHLGSQLPLVVRGAYYDQFRPARQPRVTRSLEEFLARIEESFRYTRPVDSKEACRTVFKVLTHHVDPGQIAKVWEALPEPVRDLWPDTVRARAAAE